MSLGPSSDVAAIRPGVRLPGAAEELARSWRAGQQPELEAFLAGRHVDPHELGRLVNIDQQERWRRGQRPTAEDYLSRFSQLAADEELALDVIYGEFRS